MRLMPTENETSQDDLQHLCGEIDPCAGQQIDAPTELLWMTSGTSELGQRRCYKGIFRATPQIV